MATTTLTVISERWLDEVVLAASSADAAVGAFGEVFTLPAGLGDVAFMEGLVEGLVLGGLQTSYENVGVRWGIFSQNLAQMVDIIGVSTVKVDSLVSVSSYVSPDPLVLWRINEVLHVKGSDWDTSTTGDVRVTVKVVRIKPVMTPSEEIHLVRPVRGPYVREGGFG